MKSVCSLYFPNECHSFFIRHCMIDIMKNTTVTAYDYHFGKTYVFQNYHACGISSKAYVFVYVNDNVCQPL